MPLIHPGKCNANQRNFPREHIYCVRLVVLLTGLGPMTCRWSRCDYCTEAGQGSFRPWEAKTDAEGRSGIVAIIECVSVCGRRWGGGERRGGSANRLKVSAPHFTADGDFTPRAPYLLDSHLGLAWSYSLAPPSRLLCEQTGIQTGVTTQPGAARWIHEPRQKQRGPPLDAALVKVVVHTSTQSGHCGVEGGRSGNTGYFKHVLKECWSKAHWVQTGFDFFFANFKVPYIDIYQWHLSSRKKRESAWRCVHFNRFKLLY